MAANGLVRTYRARLRSVASKAAVKAGKRATIVEARARVLEKARKVSMVPRDEARAEKERLRLQRRPKAAALVVPKVAPEVIEEELGEIDFSAPGTTAQDVM